MIEKIVVLTTEKFKIQIKPVDYCCEVTLNGIWAECTNSDVCIVHQVCLQIKL